MHIIILVKIETGILRFNMESNQIVVTSINDTNT